MALFQTYKDIKRLKQISDVLFKHGLGYVLERIHLKTYLTFHKKVQASKFTQPISVPVRLRSAMEELGGGFVKLGQMLSLRKDLLPDEYCDEFSKLQDSVKPIHFKLVQLTVESELKKPINRVFSHFETTPLASASIGQVHRAKLRDGGEVVVKVQRPNIGEIFRTDIDILYHIARLAERHMPELAEYKLQDLIKEFEEYTIRELDYLREARNIETFYRNFRYDPTIKIPAAYQNYTTSKVLVMEFIDGIKISELKNNHISSNAKKIVENVNKSFIRQILEFGFFHADPHPGNILILPNNRFALLDFGIVGRITPELKEKMEDLLIGLVKPDNELLASTFISLGLVRGDTDIDMLAEDLEAHFSDYYDVALDKINVLSLLMDCFAITKKYKVTFPSNVVLLIKAMSTTEAFNNAYNPDFNFVETAKPIVKRLMKKKMSPAYLLGGAKKNLINFKNVVTNFPRDVKSFVRMLQHGANLKIEVDHKEIRELTQEMDRSSNRLTFGLIIAALIVAASLIIAAKIPPLILGIPLLAHVAFIFIIISSLLLIISMLREKGGV
ncbi:AarF/ABC1/UbiB kinase family protein [Candidatus Woesearchaeota archaeon]|nr:AarF/ABC1/UbiB kinase family protein [Candidatus Woesearchaeota archaeon]